MLRRYWLGVHVLNADKTIVVASGGGGYLKVRGIIGKGTSKARRAAA